jgi:hypothetical protein
VTPKHQDHILAIDYSGKYDCLQSDNMVLKSMAIRWFDVNERESHPRVVVYGSLAEYLGAEGIRTIRFIHGC